MLLHFACPIYGGVRLHRVSSSGALLFSEGEAALSSDEAATTGWRHSAYGLSIVANRPVPSFGEPSRAGDLDSADVLIEFLGPRVNACADADSVRDQWSAVGSFSDVDGDPSLIITRGPSAAYVWTYRDGTRFVIAADGSRVSASWSPESTIEDTATYLAGPILGFVSRLRGRTSLHASAVVVNGQAVAFVGIAGVGKSTTVAALVRQGFPMLAEDVLALEVHGEQVLAYPGYPHVRLWPESTDLLFGSPDALPCLTPNWDKRDFDIRTYGGAFAAQPVPLGAVFFLQERRPQTVITRVSNAQMLLSLLANAYVTTIHDETSRTLDFRVFSRIFESVPLFLLHAPEGAAIMELGPLIVQQLRATICTVSSPLAT